MLSLSFLVFSCGGPAGDEENNSEGMQEGTQTEQKGEAMEDRTMENEGSMAPQDVTLNLYAVGETMTTMTFEPERLEVSAGANVTLKLMNKAKSEAMIHNAVIIQAGKQQPVVDAGLEAGPDRGYIPESPYIIAATSLAKPGEEVEVSFKAPDKTGTYQFICTYPGHTAMKGILLVK